MLRVQSARAAGAAAREHTATARLKRLLGGAFVDINPHSQSCVGQVSVLSRAGQVRCPVRVPIRVLSRQFHTGKGENRPESLRGESTRNDQRHPCHAQVENECLTPCHGEIRIDFDQSKLTPFRILIRVCRIHILLALSNPIRQEHAMLLDDLSRSNRAGMYQTAGFPLIASHLHTLPMRQSDTDCVSCNSRAGGSRVGHFSKGG